jgi:hypothetical protein
MNELDVALRRHYEERGDSAREADQAPSITRDFADRMGRAGVSPIPIGDFKDLGVTGWLAERRAASFQQKERGWVLPNSEGGMIVTTDGRLLKGPDSTPRAIHRLQVMQPGQKKTVGRPSLSFYFPPKSGFAFCYFEFDMTSLVSSIWSFKEVSPASAYVGDLAAGLAAYGVTPDELSLAKD